MLYTKPWLVFKDCLMTTSIKFIHRHDGVLIKRVCFGVSLPGFKPWFHYLLAIWSWASTSILPSFSHL